MSSVPSNLKLNQQPQPQRILALDKAAWKRESSSNSHLVVSVNCRLLSLRHSRQMMLSCTIKMSVCCRERVVSSNCPLPHRSTDQILMIALISQRMCQQISSDRPDLVSLMPKRRDPALGLDALTLLMSWLRSGNLYLKLCGNMEALVIVSTGIQLVCWMNR